MNYDMNSLPHRRKNLLTGEWVLVSPQRSKRPWQGQVAELNEKIDSHYEENCYLCPGNIRAGGKQNPDYEHTFVFENDFPALIKNDIVLSENVDNLLISQSVSGEARVICFSKRHDLSLAEMPVSAIEKVVAVWVEQIRELGQKYEWVQIFENKGEIVGCSNSHPHGQVWAGNFLPNEIVKEDFQQLQYYKKYGKPVLLDYIGIERQNSRVVEENDEWIFLVPYWAYWPFETLLLPKRHILRLTDLSSTEQRALAEILKKMLSRYDNLFRTSFPYMSGWHGAPTNNADNNHWQLHAHFYPPLLRSAKVQKFVASYEWLAEAQRDITAEKAAELLREQSSTHYKEH